MICSLWEIDVCQTGIPRSSCKMLKHIPQHIKCLHIHILGSLKKSFWILVVIPLLNSKSFFGEANWIMRKWLTLSLSEWNIIHCKFCPNLVFERKQIEKSEEIIARKFVQILFSKQQMAEKRPNGCGAIARNRNPLMICAKKTAAITITTKE